MSLGLFSLEGKVVLITGATNGIGQSMAQGLYEAGAEIIFTYRNTTNPELTVEYLQKNCVLKTQKISYIECDIVNMKIEDIKENLFEKSLNLSSTGKIDILINNAGIQFRESFEKFPIEEFNKIIHVNLLFPIELTKLFGNYLIKNNKKGKIVFTASLLSFQGGYNSSAYATSKGGILQFCKSISTEWSSKGINVNCIGPGYIKTKLTKNLQDNYDYNKKILDRIPYGRWGNPDEFKGPIVFLCSEASNYVCGECLMVDGGWMAR